MTLSSTQLAHLLAAIAALLVAAHTCGYVFTRLRQPRVIGEILGGLLLGPTVLGALAPDVMDWLFSDEAATVSVLGAIYQLGLLLLMFVSGAEIRSVFGRSERRTVAGVTIGGTGIPFLAGLAVLPFIDPSSHLGPAGQTTAFVLVAAVAVAVTSIPVISRILFDLGILETSFARIVLTAAVVEDVVLYVVLALALGLVTQPGEDFGVAAWLGLRPGSAASTVFHVLATFAFFGAAIGLGRPLYRATLRSRFNALKRGSPVAFQLVSMLAATILSVALGVTPMFGAFAAGLVTGAQEGGGAHLARERIKEFSSAFFIPLYFAIVGLRLDLLHAFDVPFFLLFFAFASVVKAGSVYGGARIAGERPRSAANLAVAMNARGGPGIVLASIAFDAGIIDDGFYAVLVVLAIVTSLLAGWWLERVVRSGVDLRGEGAVEPPEGGAGAGAQAGADSSIRP